jgi:L-fuconolactonase
MNKIIDTHIHIWNFTKARYAWLENNTTLLNRHYEIEELEPARKEAGITGGVLVQAANNTAETDYMLEVAAATPWIQGVVGWLPLTDPSQTAQLLETRYLGNPYFKGVRHLIHDEQDPTWLLQPEVISSLRILASQNIVYDVVGVLPEHLETALEVAEKVPGLGMVFDHLNQPPIASGEQFGRWGILMKAAAMHDKFHVKISGLGVTAQKGAGWAAKDIDPYIAFVLEHFGMERAFCGGDWPVCLLAGSYTAAWSNYKEVLAQLLDKADQQKLLATNAERFYRLT